MPPRKPREARSTAPTPSPAPGAKGRATSRGSARSSRSRSTTDGNGETSGVPSFSAVAEENEDEEEDEEVTNEVIDADVSMTKKEVEDDVEEAGGDEEAVEEMPESGADAEVVAPHAEGKEKSAMEDRVARLKELRTRMNQSTAANRRDLVSDHQKQKVTAKELQRLEKQKKLAQTLRLKSEAEASGEDMERRKAWEWSIEQNERWEAKQEESKIKSDTHFHNAEDDAWKKYNRDIRSTKADLSTYEKQKEAALGLAPGTLVPVGASGSGSRHSGALSAAEDLYRGADTLSYGDSKPSEDAVDRVIGKINKDIDKPGKRKKKPEEEGEINYINDRNKVFNKKVARYYDKYTKEIRANFERGTAL